MALRIVETDGARGVSAGTFAHALVGANGAPASKLQGFENALVGADVDVALVKFCHVDVEAGTDARALFARYQETLAALRARHPRTTFVHVTVPLTAIQGGVKAIVKRLTGRAPAGVIENARREEFNELLRRAVRGKEPLFDLAEVESTAPDGARATHEWGGRAVPALVPQYTDDGGHLAGEGRARAARQLVAVLAAASRGGAFTAR
ncbi:MAG TPA: hypothetical protein VIW03_01490 [Anaeromyxobacter sp.]